MMGFGLMGLGLLLPLLFIVAIVAYVAGWRPTQVTNGSIAPPERQRSALDVLNERYARGEIGQEEYQEMRREKWLEEHVYARMKVKRLSSRLFGGGE